ncbi:Hypothetical predicted protein [Olea europaea subsp. europaea]|uniref:Uncharacterized protein n=1 Tax=Olea europaea subsp. europaea TaxID=158383 RepID=A0A8S0TUP4_OLEEU|nr:Hypothetical predicted protein [Olea europaea subsp. europaea]
MLRWRLGELGRAREFICSLDSGYKLFRGEGRCIYCLSVIQLFSACLPTLAYETIPSNQCGVGIGWSRKSGLEMQAESVGGLQD